MKITIAHDPLCPWCWIAVKQVAALTTEFPEVEFDWQGYELFPEPMEFLVSAGSKPDESTNKPKTPSRLQLAYAAQNMVAPIAKRPSNMRTHLALVALEVAKAAGKFDSANNAIYSSYWGEGKNIGDRATLIEILSGIVSAGDLNSAWDSGQFDYKIVPFDDPAHEQGIWNVPTYIINGERYAEEPIMVLREKIAAALAG